jgi:hypothetical protein
LLEHFDHFHMMPVSIFILSSIVHASNSRMRLQHETGDFARISLTPQANAVKNQAVLIKAALFSGTIGSSFMAHDMMAEKRSIASRIVQKP